MARTRVAIKVDVDTYRGARLGVPRLGRLLKELKVPASFFLSLGPDRSGIAVSRVFTQPSFLRKMRRSRAVSTYGLRTVLSGTLLPPPMIGRKCADNYRRLADMGFEVGVHAWDHFGWIGRGDNLDEPYVARQWERSAEVFSLLFGFSPASFAAPGWIVNSAALNYLSGRGLSYLSLSRGQGPYFLSGSHGTMLEIPTTLPTTDELMSGHHSSPTGLAARFIDMMSAEGLHVWTVHAEVEGMACRPMLWRVITALRDKGAQFVTLCQVADRIIGGHESAPRCEMKAAAVPGRAGLVAIQGDQV